MTNTSAEFGQLVFPASKYLKQSNRARQAASTIRDGHETPLNGNWTMRRSESTVVPDLPAGMRLPKAHETGLGEQLPNIADKLMQEGADESQLKSMLQQESKNQVSRYNKGSKIGILLEDTNKELMKNHKSELSAKQLRRLAIEKDINHFFNEKQRNARRNTLKSYEDKSRMRLREL